MIDNSHLKNKKTTVEPSTDESYYLEGSKSRISELKFLLKVMWEFFQGFRVLHFIGPCVTVFGSARFKEDHEYYKLAQKIGGALVKKKFAVMTGGGPGIMEAANRGAREANGQSVGATIILPMESTPNPYMDKWVAFEYFFVRKYLLFKYSYGFVVLPGGVGTMDELFETLTLIQTKKIKDFPVVLMGVEYFTPLKSMLESMAKIGTIDHSDLDLVLVTDSVEEAVNYIEKIVSERFNLSKKYRIKPSKILGEGL
ncbi:MAG: TIGR00730 family Rossman fold protein [Bacteroidetes bacterium]|nr:TIGR00730 family Rossman fold protein [Bacteroidota bacterium]